MVKIAPSVLSADFSKMGEDIRRMEDAGADLIHCDVMDGIFVPNITFGFKMITDIKKRTKLPVDVHLMIDRPERYVERFIDAGADILTFHVEATDLFGETLERVRAKGIKCGGVVSPDTDVSVLKPYIRLMDLALLMSVYPGFGGQKFIETSYARLRGLKALALNYNALCEVEIDGGVNLDNAAAIVEAGADILVAGNALFTSTDARRDIARMKASKL